MLRTVLLLIVMGLVTDPATAVQPRMRIPAQFSPEASGQADEVDIYPTDPALNTSGLEGSGYRIHRAEPESGETLAPAIRDRLLKEMGLSDAVRTFDALDRDLLILRARDDSFDELRTFYPRLPAASLRRLHAALDRSATARPHK